jgi:hypothetical protein
MGKVMDTAAPPNAWMVIAIPGILGGFVERMVPNLLQRANDKEDASAH